MTDPNVAASLALASQPVSVEAKADSLFDLIAPSEMKDLLPSFSSGKSLLLWLIANPGNFLIMSKALPVLVQSGITYSDKLENGLIPVERVVASALDSVGTEAPAVSILSELTEDQLVEELVNRARSTPQVASLGVQGVSGIQINKGQVVKTIGMLFREALPFIMPLLLGKLRG